MPSGRGHRSQSGDDLRQKIDAGTGSADDFRALADFLVAAGRDEEAIALYQRALGELSLSTAKEAELSMELGWRLYNLGRLEEASASAQRALEVLGQTASTARIAYLRGASHGLLAHSAQDVDRRATAQDALRALAPALSDSTDLTPEEKAWVQIDAARLCWLAGDTDGCLGHCEQALAFDLTEGDRLSCLCVYAEALRAVGRVAEARSRLTEALGHVKSYRGAAANIYFALGLTERAAGDPAAARRVLQDAIRIGRADPSTSADANFLRDVCTHLGFASYELGMHEDAARSLNEALENCGDEGSRTEILLVLGYSYSALGRVDEARRSYEAVLTCLASSADDRESARSALASQPAPTGRLAAFGGRACLYANLLWQHVVFYGSPTLPEHYHSRLGAIHFKLGNFRRSARNFEKSEAIRHPSAHELARYNAYYLGFACLSLGDQQKARDALERYLAYNPRDSYVCVVVRGLRAPS
jgi:tetratricopeptide (TPR) repeat protein